MAFLWLLSFHPEKKVTIFRSFMKKKRVIIMGAGGRDFHNFNVFFRDKPEYHVAAFTAAQIPLTAGRIYPPSLAGRLYPKGIPIHNEDDLPGLIRSLKADTVVFAYSDVSHSYVMHRASEALASGADFMLLGPDSTMLKSRLPVISVCAVRTGCGKSPVTRKLMNILKRSGHRPVAIRHPMAYCDLNAQRAQRFSDMPELDSQICSVEEREEYEPLVEKGFTVFAGVDYGDVLKMAEKEGDVIVWDGGNNDFPFIFPDLEIVVADALRPGQCDTHHPGETNLRRADVVLVNKVSDASREGLKEIKRTVRQLNPSARIIAAGSRVSMYSVDSDPRPVAFLKGKKVLVIEDGPTLTHGGMSYGAGTVAAREAGARLANPWPNAKGELKDLPARYPHLKEALPAVGYSPEQLKDLEETIKATRCDAVIFATPVNLVRLVNIDRPAFRVTYSIIELGRYTLTSIVKEFLGGL